MTLGRASGTLEGAVLVTGATGTVGSAVVADLVARGVPVRAGVLDPVQAQLAPGAEPVRLDVMDTTTAAPALRNVDRAFLMRPPAVSAVQRAFGPIVAAAASAALRQVVVLSVMGVNPVAAAGLPMTALRPAYFAQNLITEFGAGIRARSQMALAASSGRVSFVDTRDVAAVAAQLLSGRAAPPGRPLTLTGPQALGFADAAALLSAELNRPVTCVPQTLLQHQRTLRGPGCEAGVHRRADGDRPHDAPRPGRPGHKRHTCAARPTGDQPGAARPRSPAGLAHPDLNRGRSRPAARAIPGDMLSAGPARP